MYLLSLWIALHYEIFTIGDGQDLIILHPALGQNEEHELVRVESCMYPSYLVLQSRRVLLMLLLGTTKPITFPLERIFKFALRILL
jgi:hypothetical protein